MYTPGYTSGWQRQHTNGRDQGPAQNSPRQNLLLPEHRAALDETLSNTVKCLPDYRNRLMKFVRFWEEHYPEYAADVVVELSPEQRENKLKYHTSTHDLRYDRLDPEMTQAFMSQFKERNDGKIYNYDHIRKFHDAILYCCKIVDGVLPVGYTARMKTYLDPLKK